MTDALCERLQAWLVRLAEASKTFTTETAAEPSQLGGRIPGWIDETN
ncbi:hypothetical protein ABZ470_39575 [Streptosporangium sp. NPDC020072]